MSIFTIIIITITTIRSPWRPHKPYSNVQRSQACIPRGTLGLWHDV